MLHSHINGAVIMRVSAYLGDFIHKNSLGCCWASGTGFLVERDPDTVLAPDFAFITKARLTFLRGGGYVRAVPDLVLETRSPSDRPREVAEKVQSWLSAGVSMVLELNPAKQVLTVYRPSQEPQALGKDDTFDGAELLPGFSLPLAALFAEE
jgi:Uma2 family endonuclease